MDKQDLSEDGAEEWEDGSGGEGRACVLAQGGPKQANSTPGSDTQDLSLK